MAKIKLRLAFREEGKLWNAYAADQGSMKESVFLGSIAMRLVRHNQKRKDQFFALMWDSFADLTEELVGKRPVMAKVSRAPESERGGNA